MIKFDILSGADDGGEDAVTTHLKLYVQCNRGEGGMILDYEETVQQVCERIADNWEYNVEEGERFELSIGRGKTKKVFPLHWKLFQCGLYPEQHVWFDVVTP